MQMRGELMVFPLLCGAISCHGPTGSDDTDAHSSTAFTATSLSPPGLPTTSVESSITAAGSLMTSEGEAVETSTGEGSSGSPNDASSTTSIQAPMCGNGVTEDEEECDHGEELNSDNAFCTDSCKWNICGDGLLLAGVELCDNGEENSNEYGHTCSATCSPGIWCGDNLVQEGDEECDIGPKNGTGMSGSDGIACDKYCRVQARRAFVTSAPLPNGAFGGSTKADEFCRTTASAAGLPEAERFYAFVTDNTAPFDSRYVSQLVEELPFIFMTGKKLASSYNALIQDGPGDDGFLYTEKGTPLMGVFVATNISKEGSLFNAQTDCGDWTSDSMNVTMRVGINSMPKESDSHVSWKNKGWWTSWEDIQCAKEIHIYCLEL